jgi:ABC-type bacteriocin/lantibiotic exporter with double-glycine peptidase domain
MIKGWKNSPEWRDYFDKKAQERAQKADSYCEVLNQTLKLAQIENHRQEQWRNKISVPNGSKY